MKIAFLGGGNMASALIGGLIAKGQDPRAIAVIEMSPAARERLASRYPVHISTAPDAAVQGAEVLVLAVKPQDMKAALASISRFSKEKLIISVAAGIRLATLSAWLGGAR
jgi:pyrroline-5-carboxylate reductase